MNYSMSNNRIDVFLTGQRPFDRSRMNWLGGNEIKLRRTTEGAKGSDRD